MLLLSTVSSCRSTSSQRAFGPAGEAFAERARTAWTAALERADSLPPSRILYDARFGNGSVKTPGNLAVVVGRDTLTAEATGPLGGKIGSYENGAFRGKQGDGYFLEPSVLRGVLGGVIRGGAPAVAGEDAGEGLLKWALPDGVTAEGVLDVAQARLTSLTVRGPRGAVAVSFSGAFDPWPEVVELTDLGSKRSLKLRRVASEPIGSGNPGLAGRGAGL